MSAHPPEEHSVSHFGPLATFSVRLRPLYAFLRKESLNSDRSIEYEWSVRGFGPTLYIFGTVPHELHRIRRGAVAPFFSKALVQQFEPSVQALIDKLISRLDNYKGTGTVINIVQMYPCLTTDVICQYAFASPYGYLDQPTFSPAWHKAVMEASEGYHFFKQFPWLEMMMRKIPVSIVKKMVPTLGSLFQLVEVRYLSSSI